jgi:hypothetical protein
VQHGPPRWKDADPTFLSQNKQGGARKAAVATGGKEAVIPRCWLFANYWCQRLFRECLLNYSARMTGKPKVILKFMGLAP